MGIWGFLSITMVVSGSCLMLLIYMQQKKEIKKLEVEALKLSNKV